MVSTPAIHDVAIDDVAIGSRSWIVNQFYGLLLAMNSSITSKLLPSIDAEEFGGKGKEKRNMLLATDPSLAFPRDMDNAARRIALEILLVQTGQKPMNGHDVGALHCIHKQALRCAKVMHGGGKPQAWEIKAISAVVGMFPDLP